MPKRMKGNNRLFTFILFFAMTVCGVVPSVTAHSQSQTETNVIERIEEESGGNVEIDIPEQILEQILTPPETKKRGERQENLKRGINKIQGYRIQEIGRAHV